MNKLISWLLLALAILAAVIFVKTKPKAVRKPMSSMIPVVTVADLQPMSAPVTVKCLGTVIPDQEASLEAEVSGQIVEMKPDVVEGGFVRKGDLLLSIDARDYELAVKRAQAAVLQAESSLLLEQGQQAVAKHEAELIGNAAPEDDASRELMLRVPQLKAAQAALQVAQANLAAAQLDLERTKISAPFDAVIETVSVSQGDFARSGKALVKLAATDRFFVRVSLPVSDLQNFPDIGKATYPAELIPDGGGTRAGELYRLLPGLSEQGRMARLLVAVKNPLSAEDTRPMLLSEVIPVTFSGKQVENVCLIERKHLRRDSTVWMMDPEGRLRILPVEVVQGYADQMLVRLEFSRDWKLVTSNMTAPVDGMQLKTAEAAGGQL